MHWTCSNGGGKKKWKVQFLERLDESDGGIRANGHRETFPSPRTHRLLRLFPKPEGYNRAQFACLCSPEDLDVEDCSEAAAATAAEKYIVALLFSLSLSLLLYIKYNANSYLHGNSCISLSLGLHIALRCSSNK